MHTFVLSNCRLRARRARGAPGGAGESVGERDQTLGTGVGRALGIYGIGAHARDSRADKVAVAGEIAVVGRGHVAVVVELARLHRVGLFRRRSGQEHVGSRLRGPPRRPGAGVHPAQPEDRW